MKKRLLGIAAAAAMLTSTLTPVYADNIGMSDIMSDTVTLGFSADEDELLEDDTEKEANWFSFDPDTHTLTLRGQLPETYGKPLIDQTANYGDAPFNWVSVHNLVIEEGTKTGRDASHMFEKLYRLDSIDGLNNLDTSAAADMSYMFFNEYRLGAIDLSGFDTSNVTNMEYMFYNCSGVEELDLTGFDTDQVTFMSSMFNDCDKLKNIKFSKKFSTARVESMDYMFADCESIEQLSLNNFDTRDVNTAYCMFMDCTSLKKLYLSENFRLTPNTYTGSMFRGCNKLEILWIPEGFEVTLGMCLHNDTEGYLGWSYDLETVVSGSNRYAEFTAGYSGAYVYISESPKIRSLKFGNGRVKLDWDELSGADSYIVNYYGEAPEFYHLPTTETSMMIDIDNPGFYDFWVTAVKNSVESTQEIHKPISLMDYGIYVGIKENGSINNVTLSWDAYKGASKYKIYCLDANGNIKTTRETTKTSFDWNGLAAGTKYGFYVQPFIVINGYNAYPLFDPSNKNDKPFISYYTPLTASPTIYKVNTGNKKAWIYWRKMDNAKNYRIYVIQNGEERLAGASSNCKFLVTDMTNDVRAYYYVKAVVDGKLTMQKNMAYSTPRAGVKPQVLSSSTTAFIRWDKYPHADKYKVIQVDANGRKLDERVTAGTSFEWRGLKKNKVYGFAIQPYVFGDYIPFGLSYPEDQANITYTTKK